jgi:hypothetical protein
VASIPLVHSLRRNCAHEFAKYCNPSVGQILGWLQNISSTVLNLNQHSPAQYYGSPTNVILPPCKSWTAVVNYLPILLLFTACFTHTHTFIHINLHPEHIYIRYNSLSTAQAGSENERSKNKEPEGIKPKTVHSAIRLWLFTLLVPSGVVMQNIISCVP